MAASGGGRILAPIALGILRKAVKDASKVLRKKVSAVTQTINSSAAAQHAAVPVRARAQPVHPAAILRQQRRLFSRWAKQQSSSSANAVGRFFSTLTKSAGEAATKPRLDRSQLPTSTTSRAIAQFSGRAPFAHTLRPNLTGGALPRSAGGYGLTGTGARYFSHTPAAPAQVVQNVSQAMRAFTLSGKRARFDGLDARGRKRYRAVSALEDDAARALASAPRFLPGSFVDFKLSPTITAMSPLAAAFPFPTEAARKKNNNPVCGGEDETFLPTVAGAAKYTHDALRRGAAPTSLNAAGFLDELALDFSRALKDLQASLADIQRLATLGDLVIELLPATHTLRVRFPGVDRNTVEALCDDVGVTRGLVGQDPGFDAAAGVPVALRFPFAPQEEGRAITSPGGSVRSLTGHEIAEEEYDALESLSEGEEAFLFDEFSDNPWVEEPEAGYGSLSPRSRVSDQEFEGIEGIYRFIEECDRAKGRFAGRV